MKLLLFGLALFASMFFLLPRPAAGATQDPKHFIVDIVAINGEEFVVKDEAGAEGKIHVGTDTQKFGQLQPGDRIDAWIFPNGHAKTIMILRSASAVKEDQERQRQAQTQQPGTGQDAANQQVPR